MNRLHIENAQYKIEIVRAGIFTDSPDNFHDFAVTNDSVENDKFTTSLDIICTTNESQTKCVIQASIGAISINEHSAFILNDSLYLAIGNEVCKIQLPNLELLWRTKSDTAACFGLYPLFEQDCIIVHGECEITRLKLTGEIEWSVSGKDIFTEGFQISATQIEVTDFNYEKYKVDINSGSIALIAGG